MKSFFLDFEKPLMEIQQKIDELRTLSDDHRIDVSGELASLT